MQQQSLVRRSLVWAGTLLGISIAWVGLLSVISVLVADRLVLSLEAGRGHSTADTSTSRPQTDVAPKPDRSVPRVDKPLTSPKPNG